MSDAFERLAEAQRAASDAASAVIAAREAANAEVMAMDPDERIANAQAMHDAALATHAQAEAALVIAKQSNDPEALEAAYQEFGRLAVTERELALAQLRMPPEPVSNPATPNVVTQLGGNVVGQR